MKKQQLNFDRKSRFWRVRVGCGPICSDLVVWVIESFPNEVSGRVWADCKRSYHKRSINLLRGKSQSSDQLVPISNLLWISPPLPAANCSFAFSLGQLALTKNLIWSLLLSPNQKQIDGNRYQEEYQESFNHQKFVPQVPSSWTRP